jgi:hypothetical protein
MSYISKKSSGVESLEQERVEITFEHTLSGTSKESIQVYTYPCGDWLGGTMIVYAKVLSTGDSGVAEYLFVNNVTTGGDPGDGASIEMTDRRHLGSGIQPISNVAEANLNGSQVELIIKNEASQFSSGDVIKGVALITLIPNML